MTETLSSESQNILKDTSVIERLPEDFGLEKCLETHISLILIGKSRVLKFKKPVKFDFLDHSLRKARHLSATKEVVLNNRHSSNIYLGVLEFDCEDLTKEPSFHSKESLHNATATETKEAAVLMNKFSEKDLLPRILKNTAQPKDVAHRVAKKIKSFHQSQQGEAIDRGSVEPWLTDYRSLVDSNSRECARLVKKTPELSFLESDLKEVLKKFQSLTSKSIAKLHNRALEGLVIDGHGDLRAEHVHIDSSTGTVSLLDCLEFDDTLRTVDVLDELAFLKMDLDKLGERAAAVHILEAYLAKLPEETFCRNLFLYFATYRSLVRLKVALLSGDSCISGTTEQKVGRHLQLASSYILGDVSKGIILIGGLMGTGKSTLARTISQRLDATVFQSDAVRRELFQATPADKLEWGEDKYSDAGKQRVYQELGSRVGVALGKGQLVLVDASFIKERDRQLFFDLAREFECPAGLLWCELDEETQRERLKNRERESSSISEGRVALIDEQRKALEEPDEISNTVRFGTSRAPEETFKDSCSFLRELKILGDAIS